MGLRPALEMQEEGLGLYLNVGQFRDRLEVRGADVERHALCQRGGVGVAVGFDSCLGLLDGRHRGLPLVTNL